MTDETTPAPTDDATASEDAVSESAAEPEAAEETAAEATSTESEKPAADDGAEAPAPRLPRKSLQQSPLRTAGPCGRNRCSRVFRGCARPRRRGTAGTAGATPDGRIEGKQTHPVARHRSPKGRRRACAARAGLRPVRPGRPDAGGRVPQPCPPDADHGAAPDRRSRTRTRRPRPAPRRRRLGTGRGAPARHRPRPDRDSTPSFAAG